MYNHSKTCIGMSMEALLKTIAKKGKQPKCQSTKRWINKTGISHTTDYLFSHKGMKH